MGTGLAGRGSPAGSRLTCAGSAVGGLGPTGVGDLRSLAGPTVQADGAAAARPDAVGLVTRGGRPGSRMGRSMELPTSGSRGIGPARGPLLCQAWSMSITVPTCPHGRALPRTDHAIALAAPMSRASAPRNTATGPRVRHWRLLTHHASPASGPSAESRG